MLKRLLYVESWKTLQYSLKKLCLNKLSINFYFVFITCLTNYTIIKTYSYVVKRNLETFIPVK